MECEKTSWGSRKDEWAQYLDDCIADIKLNDHTSTCSYALDSADAEEGPLIGFGHRRT